MADSNKFFLLCTSSTPSSSIASLARRRLSFAGFASADENTCSPCFGFCQDISTFPETVPVGEGRSSRVQPLDFRLEREAQLRRLLVRQPVGRAVRPRSGRANPLAGAWAPRGRGKESPAARGAGPRARRKRRGCRAWLLSRRRRPRRSPRMSASALARSESVPWPIARRIRPVKAEGRAKRPRPSSRLAPRRRSGSVSARPEGRRLSVCRRRSARSSRGLLRRARV